MSCEDRIGHSRGLAHLPARVTAATARLSIMTSFIGNPKTPQIRGISLKHPPARGPFRQRLERGGQFHTQSLFQNYEDGKAGPLFAA